MTGSTPSITEFARLPLDGWGPQGILVRRLSSLALLADDDRIALMQASALERAVDARVTLYESGDVPNAAYAVIEGFACTYKDRSTGQRQILSYLLPGDLCDADLALGARMDHSLGTLTPCRIARLGGEELAALTQQRPRIAQALRISKLITEARSREWLISLGCRTALERTAHLLCEVLARLEAVGLANGSRCELPLTQADLAFTLGLSSVHVNRMLQTLRADGLIELRGKKLVIRQGERLRELADFSPDYLRSLF